MDGPAFDRPLPSRLTLREIFSRPHLMVHSVSERSKVASEKWWELGVAGTFCTTESAVAREAVEENMTALDVEADRLCNAQRYERSAAHSATRAGHYKLNLQSNPGEVRLRVPK